MRIRLVIAYDGQPYSGWQSQPGGNTIQDHLSQAAKAICGQRLTFHGSGRTDAGVHAIGQVSHLDAPPSHTMGAPEWQAALNSHLPPTIRILDATPAPDDFHAQYSAKGKTYTYRIAQTPVLPPQIHGRAWHLYCELDLDAMRGATAVLEGHHDFARFAATRGNDAQGNPQDPKDTHRTITSLQLKTHQLQDIADIPVIDLEFTGDGFLYKMVHMLTAAIVHCGQHKLPLDDLAQMLADPAGGKCTFTAPASGLTLTAVHYP